MSLNEPGKYKADWFFFSVAKTNKNILGEIGMTWNEVKNVFQKVHVGFIPDDAKSAKTVDYTKCVFEKVFNYWIGKKETWSPFEFLPDTGNECVKSTEWEGGLDYRLVTSKFLSKTLTVFGYRSFYSKSNFFK